MNTAREFLDAACAIAKENGEIMKKYENAFDQVPEGLYLNEFVANEINNNIATHVKQKFPEHRMYRKGDSTDVHEGYEWICDPLDGAFCYSKGYRVSVTSVTLTLNGKSIVSAVYDPWNDRMYSAELGGGAWMNGSKISVNNNAIEKYTLINREWWHGAAFDIDTPIHNLAETTGAYIVHQGSVIHSACLVASGVFSVSVFGGFVQGKNHEVAAAKLIVEEAGGKITDLSGKPIGFIGDIRGFVISNTTAHDSMCDALSGVKQS